MGDTELSTVVKDKTNLVPVQLSSEYNSELSKFKINDSELNYLELRTEHEPELPTLILKTLSGQTYKKQYVQPNITNDETKELFIKIINENFKHLKYKKTIITILYEDIYVYVKTYPDVDYLLPPFDTQLANPVVLPLDNTQPDRNVEYGNISIMEVYFLYLDSLGNTSEDSDTDEEAEKNSAHEIEENIEITESKNIQYPPDREYKVQKIDLLLVDVKILDISNLTIIIQSYDEYEQVPWINYNIFDSHQDYFIEYDLDNVSISFCIIQLYLICDYPGRFFLSNKLNKQFISNLMRQICNSQININYLLDFIINYNYNIIEFIPNSLSNDTIDHKIISICYSVKNLKFIEYVSMKNKYNKTFWLDNIDNIDFLNKKTFTTVIAYLYRFIPIEILSDDEFIFNISLKFFIKFNENNIVQFINIMKTITIRQYDKNILMLMLNHKLINITLKSYKKIKSICNTDTLKIFNSDEDIMLSLIRHNKMYTKYLDKSLLDNPKIKVYLES